MSFYTPRGLKINLPVEFAFALMARLYPRVKPFTVLKTAEGIELLPLMFAFGATLTTSAFEITPWISFIAIFSARIAGMLITIFGFYVIPGLVTLSTFFRLFWGYGLYTGIMMLAAYFGTGPWGVIAVVSALCLSFLTSEMLDYIVIKRAYSETGVLLTASERNFVNAYRIHADAIGVTVDITATDEELDVSNWGHVLDDLARNWPIVAQRLRIDS